MVKNMQIESRQPSVQSTQTNLRRRSNRASSALTMLLAVQACSLGTVVSARPPGILIARSESGSFQSSSATITTPLTSSPYQSNEAKLKYRQVEMTQDQSSLSSQPSITAIARSIGEFPTVTLSSSSAAIQSDSESPVLLRQAEPTASINSSSSVSIATSTSTSAAAFDVQPTSTETTVQPAVTPTNDGEEDNNIQTRDNNSNDGDSDDSNSSDQGSSSESCSEDDDDDQQYRQENVQSFPVANALGQLGSEIPLKRYVDVYDAALTSRSLYDFIDTMNTKRSWFDDALTTQPNKIQKDDSAMYSVMKRMIDSHQKQIEIHKRLLDLVKTKRQDDSMTTTEDDTAFPIVSNLASPSQEEERRDSQPTPSPAVHSQWDEHQHQRICAPPNSPNLSATITRREQDKTDEKHHQLLASAMSDWSFVSGWLSSRLPVDLHKQVIEALHEPLPQSQHF